MTPVVQPRDPLVGAATLKAAAAPARLLVLDDSQTHTASLMEMLACVEVAYVVAAGRASTRAMRSITDQPRVIVLDMRKGRESAAPLLRELRQHAGAPLVLLLTNCPDAGHAQQCLEAGADYYFAGATQIGEFSRALQAELAGDLAQPVGSAAAPLRGKWTSLLVMD
jgi:DNA-binding response OmpR family regulator